MNLRKKIVSDNGGVDRVFIFFFFWQFFSTGEKITQFLRCCKYQGGKI